MCCHFLLWGIFPIQGSNQHLLPWQADSLPLSHQGSPLEWQRINHYVLLSLLLTACMLSHWVVSNSLRPLGLQPARLLCPWGFPGKSTGVGRHFLLQGIFLTQGSNPHLLPWQADSLPLGHQWSPNPGFRDWNIQVLYWLCDLLQN